MRVMNCNPEGLLRVGGQGSNGNFPHIFALCLKATVEGGSAEVMLYPT